MNQMGHPYTGNLYYSSTRSHGFNYWASIPFTLFGSAQWEYMMTTGIMSANDLFTTTIGGVALGEASFRLSNSLQAHRGTRGNLLRDVASFVLNPVGFLHAVPQRDVWGEAFESHGRTFSTEANVGLRVPTDSVPTQADVVGFVDFRFDYGNPFEPTNRKPFDHFEFQGRLDFAGKVLGRFRVRGSMVSKTLGSNVDPRHAIGLFQHFEYDERVGHEIGGQSVSLGLQSRAPIGRRLEFRSRGDLMGHMLAAVGSIRTRVREYRRYDFASGLGLKWQGRLDRDGRRLASVEYTGSWFHVWDGTPGHHFAHVLEGRMLLPVNRVMTLGMDVEYYLRNSNYREVANVRLRDLDLRFYVGMWLGQ